MVIREGGEGKWSSTTGKGYGMAKIWRKVYTLTKEVIPVI